MSKRDAKTGTHPKHPPCPSCGRALYKSPKPARVKKTDPWKYCRNPKCESFGAVEEPEKEATPKPAPVPPVPNGPIEEHEAVKKARERIQKSLHGQSGEARNMIGLTLALLAQELGHRQFANALVDEYNLTELFGIQKFD